MIKDPPTPLLVREYPHIEQLRADLTAIVNQQLLPEVNEALSHEYNFINELRKEILTHNEIKIEGQCSLEQKIDSRDKLLAKVTTAWLTPEPKELDKDFPEFHSELVALIANLDEFCMEIQLEERFLSQEGDGWLLRIRKFWKRFFYRISIIPQRLANLFRKKKRPIEFWRHKIPFRELARHYFRNQFIRDIQNLSQIRNSKLASVYLQLKKAEEALFLTDEIKQEDLLVFEKPSVVEMQEQALKIIAENIILDIDDLIRRLIKDYEKVGTIELSQNRFKATKVAKRISQAEKLWSKTNYHWNNTLYALFEEWRADLELHRLKYQAIAAVESLRIDQKQRHEEHVVTKVDLIRNFVNEANEILSSGKETSSKRLKKVLLQSRKQLDKNLVPSLVDAVSSKNYLGLLNNLEYVIRTHIEAISDDHVIAKTNEYNLPLSPAEIAVTSPYELINFELLSTFEDKLENIKSQLLLSIEKATSVFRDIDHVIIFSLSSGLSVLEDDEEKEEEAISIALEGITRANSRLTEGLELLTEAQEQTASALQTVVDEFNGSLIELTDNDSVFELKMRITKAKTLQQAEEVRDRLKERFSQYKDKAVTFVIRIIPNITKAIEAFRARFILTAKTKELSREMSDFLLESQSAMDKLPTIYRQLYKLEALTDLELFEGREEELESFTRPLNSWEKGRFSSTVIVGEKWGGQTSFLNYLISTQLNSFPITRISLLKQVNDADKFFELLKNEINKPEIGSLEELIDELNDGPKRIIILEDLQNVFTRKIGGFSALTFLFKLISQTGINVFWISTITIHSWSYLEKTVKINEYFSYIIKMAPFSNDQIKSIILKRNSISGFQIMFEAEHQQLESKKFTKLTAAQQQELLEQEFFKDLCDFAKSNVSMALIFWLLSTNKVDSRQITIGKLKRPNLNLLGALSSDKVQILYALILHDGLAEDEISTVQHMSPQLTNMLILSMEEDSIIIEKNGIYTLNPLIYRDAIIILKTKNLIQ